MNGGDVLLGEGDLVELDVSFDDDDDDDDEWESAECDGDVSDVASAGTADGDNAHGADSGAKTEDKNDHVNGEDS
jgi:hypothetical protein